MGWISAESFLESASEEEYSCKIMKNWEGRFLIIKARLVEPLSTRKRHGSLLLRRKFPVDSQYHVLYNAPKALV